MDNFGNSDMSDLRQLIEAVKYSSSAPSLIEAVRALAATGQEAAVPTLVEVLGYNNPGAAVAAVGGIVAIGETAVPYLLNNLDSYDYGARAWATRALAGIADPRALELLIEAAKGDFALSVRRAAAKGIGNLSWSKLSPQQASAAQKAVFQALQTVAKDPEWVVRYAAVVGLQSLALAVKATDLVSKIVSQLEQVAQQDSELAVRTRARLGIQQINAS